MAQSKPKLYHLQTSQSLRVLWCLKFLDVEYDIEIVPRRESRQYPEFKAVHDLGKSPILVLDGHSYAESRICIDEIVRRYGSGRLEKHGSEKTRDDYYAEFSSATLLSTVMFLLMFDLVGQRSPWLIRPLMKLIMSALIALFSKELEAQAEAMECALAEDTPFFGGKFIGVSDFMLSWPIDLAVGRNYIDLQNYPKLGVWYKLIHGMDSYRAAVEETGVYDVTSF